MWETDVLGEPYQRHTIELGDDDEGPVVATLVRRPAERSSGRAVLYVHGFNDYFFQTHLADWYAERGLDFYALDLRKYGRSLLPHQTPNFIKRIPEYFPELDQAVELIRTDHHRLLINAHSTGGLITALWAHRMRDHGLVDAMFLNSPFFELNVPWVVRRIGAPIFGLVAYVRPYAVVPSGVSSAYGHSIHADQRGEWRYDLAWKPVGGFRPRAGWLAGIRAAQARLRAGLAISAPILVGSSAASYHGAAWSEAAQRADAVLDVEHISRYATRLGRQVTVIRFDGGLHDLTLSAPAVRARVFTELGRWLDAYLPD